MRPCGDSMECGGLRRVSQKPVPSLLGEENARMSRELRADYTTRFLFPPALEDWVKADDPARFIRAFVDSLDLREIAGEEWARGSEDRYGRPHYAFDLLLKVWLYGYLYNIRSSRKLERECRERMPLVWLGGRGGADDHPARRGRGGYLYNIRSSRKLERECRERMPLVWLAGMYEPDHNTLWRFWTRYSKVLKKVFAKSVRVALKANLVGMVVQAVDGTKIASAASQKKGWHRKDLEKILAAVGERIATLEQQIATAKEGGAEIDDR